jgi:4-diphosphocytidyl-2-C-methyl-D-erythritol kinase
MVNQDVSKSMEVRAPAKLNARLKVTARRPDGYHELESIMVPVGLYDDLRVVRGQERGIRLKCRGLPLPSGKENLVHRAAADFFSRTPTTAGVSIELHKTIPVAAGMGGGSSDAAATIVALNRLWDDPLPPAALERLAVGLGADVPFFLKNCPCIARGIGEVLEPIGSWPKFWYVIVTPPVAVSTAWVYDNLKLELTTRENNSINRILEHDAFRMADILENDLEAVTTSRFPVINTIKDALLAEGALGALMTGSGPSVFGVFDSEPRALRAERELARGNWGDMFVAEGIA